MTARKPLTLAAIRAMTPGQVLWDHVVTGLHVRRRATITTFDLYYRTRKGVRRWYRLNEWPTLTLELARDTARALLAQVAEGRDPAAEKSDWKAAPTIADLCAEWEKRKAPPVKKPRSFREDQYNFKNHILPRLGKRHVADVTSADVKAAVDAIARERGPVAARNVRTLLSGLFRLASHSELNWRAANANPVKDVPAPKSVKRRAHIGRDQFAALNDALEGLRGQWPAHVACIWVALYCGTRITELATARHAHRHGSKLILSEHKTDSTGDDRVIQLSAPAVAELDALPQYANGFIFGELGAMNADGKDSARRSVHYVFDLARTRAGLSDIRPQDLRRTFASLALSRGVSLSQVGELFSHGSTQTTKGYAWLFDDAAQETANSVGVAIRDLAKGSKPALKLPAALRLAKVRKRGASA